MKSIFTTIIFLCLIKFSVSQVITEYTLPPAPLYQCGDAPARLNQILYGATPPNSQQKPVVVFVHGWFDNGYAWFMAKNQWYQNMYNQGIRTAFLFQSQSGSFQDNGRVVADMIRKICVKYNTNKVIAVCHSKGGFDIEWAMYNYGIYDSVAHVITLNTPFYGAPMVDLISNPIVRLITESIPIVGPIFKGAGTYQMSPSYMKGVVRPMLDNHPKNDPTKFKCHGTWGFAHPTVLPNPIPDDILKVVFYDYKPLCLDIPGLSQIGSGLMSVFMAATGLVSSLIPVQHAYQNPQKNTYLNDGLAPYYSSIRPGGIEISEKPNAESSNLNHIDVLLSKYTWNVVNDELQQIMQGNNNYRISDKIEQDEKEEQNILSNMQLIRSDNFDFVIDKSEQSSIMLVGNYADLKLEIFDEQNKTIHTETIQHEVRMLWELFKIIPLQHLANGKYILKFNQNVNAIVIDDSKEKLALEVKNNIIKVKAIDWNINHEEILIHATLNRNIDENGQVIWDKIIPINLRYNANNQTFESDELGDIETGNYNISVYAKNNHTQRFATTNYYFKELKQNNSNIKIFPNVATSNFTIQWNNVENISNVDIYDLQGKLIFKKDVFDNQNELQLNAEELKLQSGMYIVKVGNASAKLMVAR